MNRSPDSPGDPDFEQRRLAARARLDAIDDAGKSDPYRRAWFEAVYESAGSDAAQIPWADLGPHPLLAAWLVGSRHEKRRGIGFWVFILSNVLWVIWGWHDKAYALIVLQAGLFLLNLRGAYKNDATA